MPDGPSQRPEDVRFISGVILVSRQPERAAGFYRDVLGLPLAEERHGDTQPHWGCELGDIHFAIHPAEDYPEDPVTGPRPRIPLERTSSPRAPNRPFLTPGCGAG